jgi:hypothetical protein
MEDFLGATRIIYRSVSDPHWLYADPDPALQTNADPDPDSSKIWNKFTEDKQNEIFWFLIFLKFNIFRPSSLPKIILVRKY